MSYTIEEVLVRKDDPLYPRTVFRILKSGYRLMEVKPENRTSKGEKYEWVKYEEYLMSDYLSRNAAEKMLAHRIAKDKEWLKNQA